MWLPHGCTTCMPAFKILRFYRTDSKRLVFSLFNGFSLFYGLCPMCRLCHPGHNLVDLFQKTDFQ